MSNPWCVAGTRSWQVGKVCGAILALGVMMSAGVNDARAAGRPMTLEDFFQLKRASDVRIHPDGSRVAYTLAIPSLADNKSATAVYFQGPGGKPDQITTSGKRDRGARWSPDGKLMVFESARSGSNQLWLYTGQGEARQLTDIATGVGNPSGRGTARRSRLSRVCGRNTPPCPSPRATRKTSNGWTIRKRTR